MKKLIAIICAVVLVMTSIFGALVFTATADTATEGTGTLADTVTLPVWENEFGNEIQLFPNSERDLIKYVTDYYGLGLTENTSKLPLTALFTAHAADDASGYNITVSFPQTVTMDSASGVMLYVEIPDFGTVTHTYDNGTPEDTSDDTTYETDKYRLAFNFGGYDYVRDTDDVDGDGDTTEYLYNEDGSIQTKSMTYYRYGTPDWYIREVGASEWTTSGTKNYYGILLESGWKGYVCIPFNRIEQSSHKITEDSNLDCLYITQLNGANRTDVFYGSTNSGVYYGYATEENPLVVSEPIFVNGALSDGCAEFLTQDSVIINGVEYNYTTGKAVTTPDASTLAGVMHSEYSSTGAYVTTGTTASLGASYGSRTATPSISVLTDTTSVLVDGFRHYSGHETTGNHAAVFSFPEGSTLPDGGYLVYAYLPSVEGNHKIYSERYTYAGAYTNCSQIVNTALEWYTLEKGATSWTTRSTAPGYSLDFADADATTGVSPDWEGWIYIPRSFWRNTTTSTAVEMLSLNPATYRKSSASQTGISGWKFSGMTAIEAFDANTTVVVGDNNKVVDIATGEVFDIDYYSAKEFAGKTELINNGSATVLDLDLLPLHELPFVGADVGSATVNGGSLGDSATYVKSNCAITSMPAMNLKGEITATRDQLLQFNFPDIMAGDIDGFMLYVKTGDKPISLGFQAGCSITEDGGATYSNVYPSYGYAGTLPILEKGATEWTTTTASTPINGVSQLPANFEGYVFIEKFGNMSDDLTKVWRLIIYSAQVDDGNEETTDDFYVDFDLGPAFTVAAGTWTKSYAGLAFVNGSTVAQNMFDGNFAVPNDRDKDMRVDILDLVQAQTEDTVNFAAFRDSYLDEYFNDADYSVVSASFSLKPLAYSASDPTTILSENPDRGYRTEMALYIKDGTPDPLYKAVYYVGDQTDEQENVSGLEFETREAAQAYIDEQVAKETTFNLTYYQSEYTEVETGTIEPENTYVIDKEVYKSKTSYYVYRAFENERDANGFMYEQLLLKGDTGYTVYTLYADTEEVDAEGNTIHNTYYRIGYDKRCVFTGDTEQEQTAVINRRINNHFKTVDGEDPIDQSKLSLTYLYLSDWNGASASDLTATEDLPDEALRTIELYFEAMKAKGKKSEVRFSYNLNISRSWKFSDATDTFAEGTESVIPNGTQKFNDDWLAENCANQGTILRHIEQLAPVVKEYADCIHNISNGFIGFVGEMAYGYQYPVVDYATVQKAIVEQLCVPNDLFFSTRSPKYKQKIKDADPDWEYFGYIAHNNDASYGEQTNSGWNSDNYQKGVSEDGTIWWDEVTKEAAYTPQGGEMFVQSTLLKYDTVPTGMQAILELAHHRHTSYSYWHGYLEGLTTSGNIMKGWMNETLTAADLEAAGIAYDPAWFKDGETRNPYEFIRDHLGYRLVAQKASVNYDASKSDKINVSVSLKNYGFAAAFNMESSLAILDANGNVIQEIVAGDPSTWYNLAPDYYTTERKSSAQGDVLTHTVSADFDALTKSGTYYIALRIDNTANQAARLANKVEVVNGYNILGSFDFRAMSK